MFGMSLEKKIIAIGPEVTIPSDSRPQALKGSHDRKIKSYTPLIAALQDYAGSGWSVCVLPSVLGARGMIQRDQLTKTLEFVGIPKQNWEKIVSCTVRTSVEGLA
jgi:hypothetical protein